MTPAQCLAARALINMTAEIEALCGREMNPECGSGVISTTHEAIRQTMSDWNFTKNEALASRAGMGIAAQARRRRDLTVRPAGGFSSPSLVQSLVARFRPWFTRAPHRPGWQMTGMGEEIVVLGEIEDSKFSGLTIYWFRAWKADVVVWVDVAEVDASWKLDRPGYIGPGGQAKPAIAGRYEKVGERVLSGQQIWMPHICLDERGNVSFSDGWHRFAWMRDHGVKAMPIVTDPGDAALIVRRFGFQLRLALENHSNTAVGPAR